MARQFILSENARRWLHRNPSRSTAHAVDVLLQAAGTARTKVPVFLSYKIEVVKDQPDGYWFMSDDPPDFAGDTINNNITYTNNPPVVAGNIANDNDTARSFDGFSQYAEIVTTPLSTDATIEGIFNWGDPTNPLMRDISTGTDGWIFGFSTSGLLSYRVNGIDFVTTVLTGDLITDWHHLAMTKEGNRVKFFVDGVLVHQQTGATSGSSTARWQIARDADSMLFTPVIADDIAFYSHAVPDDRIARHYDAYIGNQVIL